MITKSFIEYIFSYLFILQAHVTGCPVTIFNKKKLNHFPKKWIKWHDTHMSTLIQQKWDINTIWPIKSSSIIPGLGENKSLHIYK